MLSAVEELTAGVSTVAAYAALGMSRATIYRVRHPKPRGLRGPVPPASEGRCGLCP